LRSVITNRPQLHALDYQIARTIVETLTGTEGVRAFRRVPYRTLRREWELVSLYHQRNRK